MELTTDIINSPLGNIIVVFNEDKICSLDYEGYERRLTQLLDKRYSNYVIKKQKNPCDIRRILSYYFDGDFNAVQKIQHVANGTDFQKKVWQALTNIKVGNTVSYSNIAQSIENDNAVRAVGLANSLNPIGIIVPCHRVIAKNGKLSGYAGGERRKIWLLKHENAI